MTVDVEQARRELTALYEQTRALVDRITQEHKTAALCSNYVEFERELPYSYLDRARRRLDRREYKIVFAGPFKNGKSTLINALLKEPGLLPVEIGECTMSISLVTAPAESQEERVEVIYLNEEEAVRNVLYNPRYRMLFQNDIADLEREFSVERAVDLIRTVADRIADDSEHRAKRPELEEFLNDLRRYRDRLGRVHIDKLSNMRQYLTTDRDNRGLGHLLLIEQVHIYRRNPFFVQKGIQVVDTPGTDSLNERQKHLTLDYLQEADAVVMLVEPRGLSQASREIWSELAKYNHDVRGKMFFVVNKFDQVDDRGLQKAEIEKLYKQIVDNLINYRLDVRKLHFVCGLKEDLEVKKMQGKLQPEERATAESLTRLLEKKHALVRSADLVGDLKDALEDCYLTGGVGRLRERMMAYLEGEIQLERLREIWADLARVGAALEKLLAPEQMRIRDILSTMKPRGQEVVGFFEQVRASLEEELSKLHSGFARAAATLLENAKEQVSRGIENAADRLNIDRIRTSLAIQTPAEIKREVIRTFKQELAERFPRILREAVTPAVRAKIDEQAKRARTHEILAEVGKSVGRRFEQELERLLEEFYATLDSITVLRAREETWGLLDREIRPAKMEPSWNETVEREFREDLKRMFQEEFVAYCENLKAVYGRYYQQLLREFLNRFGRFLDDVVHEVRRDPDRVTLPYELLNRSEEEFQQERRNRLLLTFFRELNSIREASARIAATLS